MIAELKRHRKPLGQLLCARIEMIGKEKSCGLGRVSVQIEQRFIRAQGVHIVILTGGSCPLGLSISHLDPR